MTLYELRCKKCGYKFRFNQGILMSFHKTNVDLLEKIKRGELGEALKDASDRHPDAAAYHYNELYKCKECGSLYGRRKIELRNADHATLAVLEQKCGACGADLEIVDEYSADKTDLPCPCCKENLDVVNDRMPLILCD